MHANVLNKKEDRFGADVARKYNTFIVSNFTVLET